MHPSASMLLYSDKVVCHFGEFAAWSNTDVYFASVARE